MLARIFVVNRSNDAGISTDPVSTPNTILFIADSFTPHQSRLFSIITSPPAALLSVAHKALFLFDLELPRQVAHSGFHTSALVSLSAEV